MRTRKRKGWFPNKLGTDLPNSKRLFLIEEDGSTVDSVHLDVSDPRLREDIVAVHFLNSTMPILFPSDDILRMTGRDLPWDYRFELQSGSSFNLEIVSVAESKFRHEVHKREDKIADVRSSQEIPLSLLKKIEATFPCSTAEAIRREAGLQNIPKNGLVRNPWYDPHNRGRLFLQPMIERPEASFGELVAEAVETKGSKPHPDKERTFLIVDNRTQIFDVDDFRAESQALEEALRRSRFAGIWLYTGYYSDYDGLDAEYALSMLAGTTAVKRNIRRGWLKSSGYDDKKGIVQLSVS